MYRNKLLINYPPVFTIKELILVNKNAMIQFHILFADLPIVELMNLCAGLLSRKEDFLVIDFKRINHIRFWNSLNKVVILNRP